VFTVICAIASQKDTMLPGCLDQSSASSPLESPSFLFLVKVFIKSLFTKALRTYLLNMHSIV